MMEVQEEKGSISRSSGRREKLTLFSSSSLERHETHSPRRPSRSATEGDGQTRGTRRVD